MAINIKLLKKVRDRIAEVPESYDQGVYFREHIGSPCGAVACIAGEAVIMSQRTIKQGVALLRRTHDVPTSAIRKLGLNVSEAGVLFSSSGRGWPAKFKTALRGAALSKDPVRAQVRAAVGYIDQIIKTGKVLNRKSKQ